MHRLLEVLEEIRMTLERYGRFRRGTLTKAIILLSVVPLIFGPTRHGSGATFTGCVLPPGDVTTDFFGGFNDYAYAAVLQPDGKIVLAGQAESSNSSYFGLVRYNTNGSLDLSFGSGGKQTSQLSALDYAAALARQSDGKIVVTGPTAGTGISDFRLARFNSNGTLDNTFGNQGSIAADFGNSYDTAQAVAVQSDGKIVVAGKTSAGGNNIAMIRCNTNGSLDSSFGTSGKVVTALGNVDVVSSIVIQSDGKLLVAGSLTVNSHDDFLVARFNTNGSLDNSFGSGGIATLDFFGNTDIVNSIKIQPDGKIVAAGLARNANATTQYFAVARFNSNGSIDSTFASGTGKATVLVGNGLEDSAKSVALTATGQIILAGLSFEPGPNAEDFSIARYNQDGSIDSTFGTNGTLRIDFCQNEDNANSVLIQPDGKLLFSGSAQSLLTGVDFAVVRCNSNGTLDPTFDGTPIITYDYCMRDNVSGNLLQLDSKTGDYLFTRCKDGYTIAGTGKIQKLGSILSVSDKQQTFMLSAGFNTNQRTGSATITLILAPGVSQVIRINATNPYANCSCSG